MDLQAVRTGIAEAIDVIEGLRVFDFMPQHAVPPCAVVGFPETIEYDRAFARGLDAMPVIPVYVFVGNADERSSQAALSEFAAGSGPASIKTAVETDQSLGGVCDNAFVARARDFKTYSVGAAEVLGCIFDVRIHG